MGDQSRCRVSACGVAILEAIRDRGTRCVWPRQPDTVRRVLPVADLVRASSRREPVARASLSRTVRRLWRAGLVEPLTDYGDTLTECNAARDGYVAELERDPVAAFAAARAAPGLMFCSTAAEWLDAERRLAARNKRSKPMHLVELTALGQDFLDRLTPPRREVNRSEPGTGTESPELTDRRQPACEPGTPATAERATFMPITIEQLQRGEVHAAAVARCWCRACQPGFNKMASGSADR